MNNRAYSILDIRAVHDDERVIEGVASTPATDRMGDVVEPMGAKFALPMPLLWQHQHDNPVGHVEFAKPGKDGIPFRARIAQIDEPGELKNLVDKAWQAVKAKLVRGVSIGFKALEYAFMEDSDGIHFTEWEWLELSLVTIPANADATISRIKSIDHELLAASGREQHEDVTTQSPGASGTKSVKLLTPKSREGAVNYTDEIKTLEATRQAKTAERQAIQAKAAEEGRTKDESEREQFDTLTDEIKAIDAELKDLRVLEAENAEQAKPVEGRSPETASKSRDTSTPRVTVKAPHAGPGIRFARVVKAIGMAHKNHRDVEVVARQMYPDDHLVQKAAVAAATSSDSDWATALIADEGGVFADFVAYLRPMTILGKFGTDGVPSLRMVPFRRRLVTQATGGSGYWVGEGKPKPLTSWTYSDTTLTPLKVANIAVVTDELLRDSSPSAETLVRDELAAALRARLDIDFIDPDKAASSGVSPASVTNGVVAVTSSGNDADAIREDVAALMDAFLDADNPPTTGVWVMPAKTALRLSLIRNALGQKEFEDVNVNGGMFEGLPVITSQHVPSDSAGDYVVLINAGDIYLADEGGITVDASREASLEMLDASLVQDATAGTATSLVSLWQSNAVGFRAERTINWAKRRASAVQVLDGVNWGEAAS